ncbi:hypothetical protein NUW58_g10406 [Xylaria curta]|uniref:Uncharacterized protein n=1 Tax=Xylaria curta TaxID=42375 RepID=A0ACC1MKT0_9PEZI|nr:hypothetical protein NUW58_g10406 [Xylaria curta]
MVRSDALASCEPAAIGTEVCDGGGFELVSLPPPVVEFNTGPGFVTLKKLPATTLSANPADVKTLRVSNPKRVAAAASRAANPSLDTSDVSIMISVLRNLGVSDLRVFREYIIGLGAVSEMVETGKH